jgi:hypothetical protein
MENQDWFRDIENTLSDYLNEYMNNNAPSSSSRNHPPGFGNPNNNPNNNRYYNQSRTREDISEHRLYLLINEFMNDYYGSMRMYQENMRDIIHLLREFRTTPPHHNMNYSFPFPDINTAQRPTTQQTQQIPNPTTPTTDNRNNFPLSTTSFAYFIQPLVAENEERVGLANEQIERAIERIIYDTSMSNSYNAVTTDSDDIVADRCPICLEDFQIGEQVLRIRACGHIFKQSGLLRWFQRNNHCPVCRGNVVENQPSPEEEPPEPTRRPQNRLAPNRAINNIVETHIRNPLMREFGNLIQTMAQANRSGTSQFGFFDFSLNDQL